MQIEDMFYKLNKAKAEIVGRNIVEMFGLNDKKIRVTSNGEDKTISFCKLTLNVMLHLFNAKNERMSLGKEAGGLSSVLGIDDSQTSCHAFNAKDQKIPLNKLGERSIFSLPSIIMEMIQDVIDSKEEGGSS